MQPLIGIAGVALKESASAVKELKKEQIEEVRSFHNPPTQVRQAGQVIHAVLEWRSIARASDIPSTPWGAVQRCLLLQVQRKVKRFNTQKMATSQVVDWIAAQYFGIVLCEAGTPDVSALVAVLEQNPGLRRNKLDFHTRCRASLGDGRLLTYTGGAVSDLSRRVSLRGKESAERLRAVAVEVPRQAVGPQGGLPGPLTVQAVTYANQTCGLLYRWCVSQLALALCTRLSPHDALTSVPTGQPPLSGPALTEEDLKAALVAACNQFLQQAGRYTMAIGSLVERWWVLKLEMARRAALRCKEAGAWDRLVLGLRVGEEEAAYRGHVAAQEAWWRAAL
eukprot:EG_transcript_15299